MKKSKTQALLATLIFLFSVCLFYYTAYWARVLHLLPRFFGISFGLTYLFGPLLYFYIKSTKSNIYYSMRHLVPFMLYVVYFFVQHYIFSSFNRPIDAVQTVLQNGHLIFYSYLIFKTIRQSKNQDRSLKKWRTELLIAYSGYVICFLFYYLLVWTSMLKVEYDYIISLAAAGFIYFVGYRGFTNPRILAVYDKSPYQNSNLSDRAAKSILSKIKEYLETEKAYLNGNLRLSEVAAQTGFTTHQISEAINSQAGVTFTEMVNKYRFETAKALLLTNEHSKIIEIAYDCGFTNKTSFNNVFKKYAGVSPSIFRKTQLKSIEQF